MKIEDCKCCGYRFSWIFINFYQLYQLSSVVVLIMISDTFVLRSGAGT